MKKQASAYMALIQHEGAIKGLSTAPVHDLRQPGPRACNSRAQQPHSLTESLILSLQCSQSYGHAEADMHSVSMLGLQARLLTGHQECSQQRH